MRLRDELIRRAQEYVARQGVTLSDELGHGVHGIVFATESQPEGGVAVVRSAIKVHEREADYHRERDVYLRLKEHGVTVVHGCQLPQLVRHDDDLRIIEMTVVSRPFVLDFAGAFLDQAPDFSEEVLDDWRIEKQEQFGDRWPEVQAILRHVEIFGVFVVDVSPNNISLGESIR